MKAAFMLVLFAILFPALRAEPRYSTLADRPEFVITEVDSMDSVDAVQDSIAPLVLPSENFPIQGELIAYISEDGLFVMDIDTKLETLLTADEVLDMEWIPDSTDLIIARMGEQSRRLYFEVISMEDGSVTPMGNVLINPQGWFGITDLIRAELFHYNGFLACEAYYDDSFARESEYFVYDAESGMWEHMSDIAFYEAYLKDHPIPSGSTDRFEVRMLPHGNELYKRVQGTDPETNYSETRLIRLTRTPDAKRAFPEVEWEYYPNADETVLLAFLPANLGTVSSGTLYWIDVSQARQRTLPGEYLSSFTWAADGRLLYATSTEDADEAATLYLVDSRGTATRLTGLLAERYLRVRFSKQ